MNAFVNEIVITELNKLCEQWQNITTEGYELISSFMALSIESQYTNSPYWGVLTHQHALRSLLSTKISQQTIAAIVDLNTMVHVQLLKLLKQVGELVQQCEQFKTKFYHNELLLLSSDSSSSSQLLKKRMNSSSSISSSINNNNNTITSDINDCELVIQQVKQIRNLFANDWNMKALIVAELKANIVKPTVDDDSNSANINTTAENSTVDETTSELPSTSQQKLIFYSQSWKLQPYLSQYLSQSIKTMKNLSMQHRTI